MHVHTLMLFPSFFFPSPFLLCTLLQQRPSQIKVPDWFNWVCWCHMTPGFLRIADVDKLSHLRQPPTCDGYIVGLQRALNLRGRREAAVVAAFCLHGRNLSTFCRVQTENNPAILVFCFLEVLTAVFGQCECLVMTKMTSKMEELPLRNCYNIYI